MVIESILLAAPALGFLVAVVAAVAIGYLLSICVVARAHGNTCS